jgi:hypothetical protein
MQNVASQSYALIIPDLTVSGLLDSQNRSLKLPLQIILWLRGPTRPLDAESQERLVKMDFACEIIRGGEGSFAPFLLQHFHY